MARKRLNYHFIIPWVCGVAVAGGAAVVAVKFIKPRNPQPYIVAGDKAMKEHDWQQAIAAYSVASELLPQEPSLHLKLGQAYFEVRTLGLDNFNQSVNEFTKAEELDPKSKDAWGGLLTINETRVEQAELNAGDMRNREQLPITINMAREAAQHLVNLDANNVQARAAGSILLIRSRLLNLNLPQSKTGDEQLSPEQMFENAIVDLTKLGSEHPENEKIPYWIARAKIYQAQQAVADGKTTMASPLFDEASNQFEQSIVAHPELVALYLKKSDILNMLLQPNGDPDPQHWVRYRKENHDTLEKAQAKVDPKNVQQYQEAKLRWANQLRLTDAVQAEAVFRDLIARFPQELLFRLQLADFLHYLPNRIEDAMAVLNEIPKLEGPPVTNIMARTVWDKNLALCRLARADIETDEFSSMMGGKQRDELRVDIQNSLDAYEKSSFGRDSRLLRVKGKFQMYDGQTPEAIQTLTAAADKHKAEHAGDIKYHPDPHLLSDEADAYTRGNQVAKAIEILENAATDSDISNSLEYQSKLAELKIRNQDYDSALPQVNWIASRNPNDPHTIVLQIRQMGPTADWSRVKPLYDKLPEQTREDLGRKFALAASLKNDAEALRIMSLMHEADPGDVQCTVTLVDMLIRTEQRDKARKVLADTRALHPDDATLNIFDKVVDNASSKTIIDDELAAIMTIKDPFQRECKLGEFYRLQDNPDEEMKHLQAALALQPDDKGVLGTIFVRYLDAKRYDDAEAMIPHMAVVGPSGADDAKGLMLRCKLALAKQDIPNALIFGRQMTHDKPEFAGSYEMYGEALHAKGELDAAIQQFLLAIEYQGTNVDAWKNLILCSVQEGKYADARNHIANACKRFPGDPTYRDMRVQFEISYGDPESVLAELNDAVQQHPEEPRNYAMLSNALVAAMRQKSQLGQADAAAQYLAQARDTLQKAVTRWPDNLPFAAQLADFFRQGNDFISAENCLKTILTHPHWKDQPKPLILLGKIYLAEHKYDDAATVLKQALSADPHSVEAYLTYAECLIDQQKYDDALAMMMPATSDLRIRTKYTDLLLHLNRGPQAEAELQDAIKASPSNTLLIDLLLQVYDAEGEYERGLRAANEIIQKDPRNLLAFLRRGKLESDGPNPDWDAAIKDLTFFRDSVQINVEGRVALAKAYDSTHERDKAIHELEVALQYDPENPQIRLSLLNDYLTSNPIRSIDADRLLKQTLAMPTFAHDPQFLVAGASFWAKTDSENAVAMIKDAMAHSKADLYYNYFQVLLQTEQPKYLQTLLDESERFTADPKTAWFIFNDRGCARAALDAINHAPTDDAVTDFTIAMDRAGAQPGRGPAETVAASVTRSIGVDKSLEMVVPRAQNSVTWRLIAITQYLAKGDTAKALPLAESALAAEDTLPPDDKLYLYQQLSSLYLNANPPMTDKALVINKKLLALRPDDMDALNNMACLLVDDITPPDPRQALVYSQRAYDLSLKAGKLNPRIYDTQGWVLIQLGRNDEGLGILHEINEPDFPEAYYHLAVGYMKQPELAAARDQAERALKMIDDKVNAHLPVDLSLKDKVETVEKQIDDLAQAKPSGKPVP